MEKLKELVSIVTGNKIKNIEILDQSVGRKTQVGILYEALLHNKIQNEEEASTLLYGNKSDSRLAKIKVELKKRLLNTLFFIDTKQEYFDEYDRAFYDCHKTWMTTTILQRRGARVTAVELLTKLHKKAARYELTNVALDSAVSLKLHYGTIVGDRKQFERYRKKVKKLSQIYQAEIEVQDCYEALVIDYVRNKAAKKDTRQMAFGYLQELEPLAAETKTVRFQFLYNFIKVVYHMSGNDYRSTIEECENAIAFFQCKAYVPNSYIRSFLYQQIVSYTQLQQYEEGKPVVDQCYKYVEKGKRAWFKVQELALTLALHAREYDAAYEILQTTIRHRSFGKLYPVSKEIWYIYQAYVEFLVATDRVTVTHDKPKRFKVQKFLNSLPIFSQDKRGMNIPILILQVMFYLQQKKYDLAYERMQNLEAYGIRHLRRDNSNFRSQCMIKMMSHLYKSAFHKAAVIRKTSKYREMLESVPLDISNQNHELEVMPYEHSWDMILDLLDNKFH